MTGHIEQARPKLAQIFKYLRDLNALRNPVPRQLSQQTWLLWIRDLPLYKSVALRQPQAAPGDDGTRPSASQDAHWLLRLRRPDIPPSPAVPSELDGWIEGDSKDPLVDDVRPKQKRTVLNADRTTRDEEFSADPARVAALRTWLQARTRWASEARPAKEALAAFNKVYALYGRLEREGESLQLCLGQGILVWDTPAGAIRYPLIHQRLQLHFDTTSSVPEFIITEADQPPELNRSLLIGTAEGIGQSLQAVEDELVKSDADLLSADDVSGLLGRLAVVLHSEGRYAGSKEPATATEIPQIGSDPVLFVQKRIQGFATALEAILEDLAHTDSVAAGLARIAGVEVAGIVAPDENHAERQPGEEPDEVLMTKEANPAQIKIAERLARHGNVLVQGPPGTGKTHTIANLIGHLLAHGKKVLVTAHTSKALRVLRDQIVPALQPLCVAVLDNETESRKQLEASVDAMVAKLSGAEPKALRGEAARLAERRRQLIAHHADLRRRIVDARQDEYRSIVIGGLAVPPTDGARFVAETASKNSWLPGPVAPGAPLPIDAQSVNELYAASSAIAVEDEKELVRWRPAVGNVASSENFKRVVDAERMLERADRSTGGSFWEEGLFDASETELLNAATALRESVSLLMDAPAWKLDAVAAGSSDSGEGREPWNTLIDRLEELQATARSTRGFVLDHGPILAPNMPLAEQLQVLAEIETHLEAGGTLGILALISKPRWRQVMRASRVESRAPSQLEHFRALLGYARLVDARTRLGARWDRQVAFQGGVLWNDIGDRPEDSAPQLADGIRSALEWSTNKWDPTLKSLRAAGFLWEDFLQTQEVPPGSHMGIRRLVYAVTRGVPPIVDARINALQLQRQRDTLRTWSRALHPEDVTAQPARIVTLLRGAIADRDCDEYALAVSRLTALEALQPVLERRNALLDALRPAATVWASAIVQRAAPHAGQEAPGSPVEAWRFRQLVEELDRRASTSIGDLQTRLRECQAEIRAVTADFIERQAWAAQVERTGLAQQQALIGWKDLVRRIGKGTGKRAGALRAEARRTLDRARDAVPVWIMPLSRVVEAFDPRSARFDVVIIDESSQCDVMGLAALYLAKDIVVVGDHEQVSPSAVGQLLSDVDRLIHQHLDGIPNKTLYDGKTSLYDLARQAFGGVIQLVEHFRCVPEIIAFSNHLSYAGKIRSLRDATSSKLFPAMIPYRVSGQRRASGAKVNDEEARTVAALIASALSTPRYSDATVGVVSLLGDEQAILIEQLVRGQVEPDRLAKAQFLCGNAAQFQGDERDVIFLSMVDSADDGPLDMRDSDMFRQRFNVAASRARDQLWVVHSLDPLVDLKPGDLRRRLIDHAQDPGALLRLIEREAPKTESDFERAVLERLVGAGYQVTSQVRVGFYRIDLVVSGRLKRLAVECDGDRYHTIDDVESDMSRQAILERLGWTFERVRGSEFLRDPDAALRPVFASLARMGILPEGPDTIEETEAATRNALVDDVIAAAHARLLPKSLDEHTGEPASPP